MHLNKFQNSIISSEYSTSKNKNQVWQKKYSLPVSSTPIQEFVCLNDIEKRVFEEIVKFDNNFTAIYFSQGWLAKKLGYCRKTINETLWSLSQRGYITSHYNHFSTCDYKLSDYFKLIPVRQLLAPSIKAFAFISLSVLSITMLHAEKNYKVPVTRVNSHSGSYIYLAKRNSHILHNQPTCKRIADASHVTTSQNFQKNIKSEKKMNNPPTNTILEFMNLTELGYARLSVFPEAALSWASSRIQKHKGIKDPFTYFHKLCKIYCQEHKVDPDWSLYQSIISKNQIDPLGPVMKGPMLVVKQPDKPVYKNYPKREERKKSFQGQEAVDRYRKKQKSWAATLPPASEETCRNMRVYFPGTDEEFEKVIAQNNKDREAYYSQEAKPVVVSHQDIQAQPITLDDADEYGPNYNDDEMYEEIIEGPIW